jgi:indole-3-glycerol phosphate synthase
LSGRPFLPGGGFGIIAEIKRRSPSGGELRPGLDPAELARVYAHSGASAVSVLTEGPRFGGCLADLSLVREAVELPVLRKDFLSDPAHVVESGRAGADAVLIITGMREGESWLPEMLAAARAEGLAALVEVHDDTQLRQAAEAGADLIGINNRNLATLATDLENCFRLAPAAPAGVRLVAESGFKAPADVARARQAGFRAVLIGETLLRAADPGEALRELAPAPAR